ncbi:hypothetical protein R5R35_005335 [Gryllus longicercus]|uniref:Accessory gland protein n=1 Tax=Gryllus longicercus TaxID=2509291 RepID=A0AAN9Z586_9ORTH
MAVLVVVMQSAIVSCLLVVLVSSVAIEIPSRIPTMPKFKGKVGGPYKCISIVSFSATGSPVGFKIDNITTEKENGLITLISGGGSTDMVLCNGIPLAVRAVVYFYVEGIGWQYFQEFSRNDICPDVNIAPHSIEIAQKYSTGEKKPHNPPWQPGHYAWTNVPCCIKLSMIPELPYRRIKGMGQLILNKTVIASGEGEIIIGPDTGTEKYGVIVV